MSNVLRCTQGILRAVTSLHFLLLFLINVAGWYLLTALVYNFANIIHILQLPGSEKFSITFNLLTTFIQEFDPISQASLIFAMSALALYTSLILFMRSQKKDAQSIATGGVSTVVYVSGFVCVVCGSFLGTWLVALGVPLSVLLLIGNTEILFIFSGVIALTASLFIGCKI